MDEHELQYNDLYKHSLTSGGLYHFVLCILIMILVFDPSPLLIQHQPSQGRALPAHNGSAAPAVVAPVAVPRESGVTRSCLDGEYSVTIKIGNKIPT